MKKRVVYLSLLLTLVPLAVLGFVVAEGEVQSSSAGMPITPVAPWLEVEGEIVSGQPISYTFSGFTGQVVAINGFMPITATMEGRFNLYLPDTSETFVDAVYGSTYEDFSQGNSPLNDNLVHITALLPKSGDYVIEIVPDAGQSYTAPFSFQISLLSRFLNVKVDDDLVQCPDALTGMVRAAVRAASAGGTVTVCEGVYAEDDAIVFGNSDVTLQGAGRDLVTVTGNDFSTFQIGMVDATSPLTSENVTISDIAVDNRARGQPMVSLNRNSNGFTLQDCRVDSDNVIGQGLLSTLHGRPHNDLTVRNCEFQLDLSATGTVRAIQVTGDRAEIINNTFNTRDGIYGQVGVQINGNDTMVSNNVFGSETDGWTNLSFPIQITGDRATVEENQIFDYAVQGIRIAGQAQAVESAFVRNNLFGDDISIQTMAIDIYRVINALVENNYVRDYPNLQVGIRLGESGGRVINNRIATKDQDGILLVWNSANSSADIYPTTIANNTIAKTDAVYLAAGLSGSFGSITTSVPITVVNNIFLEPVDAFNNLNNCGLRSTAPLQMADYNLIYGHYNTYCDEAVAGPHDILDDPEFLDGALHLKLGSPAIDNGTDIGAPSTDFEGESRPANLGVDIGADERSVPADLAVIKSGPAYGFTGVVMPYRMEVTNNGPAVAQNVQLVDTFNLLTNTVAPTTSQGTCQGDGPVTCSLGSLDPGESVEITLDLNLAQAGVLTNTVQVSATEIDNNMDNNTDIHLTNVAEPPPGPFDVTISSMEVTQGIQDLDNFVILVADKPTAVRLYLESDGETVPNMMAVLHGSRDGQPLPGSPLDPVPGYEAGVASTDGSSRADLGETPVFLLPESWRWGLVTLTAEVNPLFSSLETNEDNNTNQAEFGFWDLPVICVKTYPLRTFDEKGNDNLAPSWRYLAKDPDGMIPRALSQLPAPDIWVYPVEKLLEFRSVWDDIKGPSAYDVEDKKNGILTRLWKLDQLSFDPDECDYSGARTHYMAMVHKDADWDRGGWADGFIAEDQLIVKFSTGGETFEQPSGGVTLAHELGHNYGRWHVPCGATKGNGLTNWNYPYDYCMFTPDTSENGFFGLDMVSTEKRNAPLELIIPRASSGDSSKDLGDLMSYAGSSWISDFNWRRIAERLCRQRYDYFPCLEWHQSPDILQDNEELLLLDEPLITTTFPYSGDILLLSGWITDSVDLTSVDKLPQDLMPKSKLDALWRQQHELTINGGPYELQLLDVNDTILYTQTFTAGVVFDGGGDAFFGLVAPSITNTEKIQIVVNGVVTTTKAASDHPPSITLLSPNGGESVTNTMTVEWLAEDMDGDPLQFTVQYSADNGASWQVIDNEIYTNSLTIETNLLPGSINMSLIRVIANDGFHTGIDESDSPFSLSTHAPLVWINNPVSGTLFETGQVIHLKGQAYDPEDGHLNDVSLTWHVPGIGEIGTGPEATIFGLTAGTYSVTLTAEDSDAQSMVASVTIKVVPSIERSPADHELFLPVILRP